MRPTTRGRVVGYVLCFLALVLMWTALIAAALQGQEWKSERLDREGGTIPPLSLHS